MPLLGPGAPLPHRPRRVLVAGASGSGKTTLAARLSTLVGIRWTSADELTWQPGWVPVPEPEQRRLFSTICAGESWILDTAYAAWLDVARARADLVVGLDHPRWLSLGRLVRRTVARKLDHRPVCNGNVESWRQTLSSDSIIAWHFRSFARKRERLLRWEQDPAAPPVLRIRSPRELEEWLASVAAELHEVA